jgi:hypothetical protein
MLTTTSKRNPLGQHNPILAKLAMLAGSAQDPPDPPRALPALPKDGRSPPHFDDRRASSQARGKRVPEVSPKGASR